MDDTLSFTDNNFGVSHTVKRCRRTFDYVVGSVRVDGIPRLTTVWGPPRSRSRRGSEFVHPSRTRKRECRGGPLRKSTSMTHGQRPSKVTVETSVPSARRSSVSRQGGSGRRRRRGPRVESSPRPNSGVEVPEERVGTRIKLRLKLERSQGLPQPQKIRPLSSRASLHPRSPVPLLQSRYSTQG